MTLLNVLHVILHMTILILMPIMKLNMIKYNLKCDNDHEFESVLDSRVRGLNKKIVRMYLLQFKNN